MSSSTAVNGGKLVCSYVLIGKGSIRKEIKRVSAKKKLSLQVILELLQNLPSENSDALTNDSTDEEVPAYYLLGFSLDS
ncbi:hypothetical protein TNCV_4871771 [Trichonephila clavipes]|nr:hypothetical protein TNCV_4871771 [Trichonephila clavipes]